MPASRMQNAHGGGCVASAHCHVCVPTTASDESEGQGARSTAETAATAEAQRSRALTVGNIRSTLQRLFTCCSAPVVHGWDANAASTLQASAARKELGLSAPSAAYDDNLAHSSTRSVEQQDEPLLDLSECAHHHAKKPSSGTSQRNLSAAASSAVDLGQLRDGLTTDHELGSPPGGLPRIVTTDTRRSADSFRRCVTGPVAAAGGAAGMPIVRLSVSSGAAHRGPGYGAGTQSLPGYHRPSDVAVDVLSSQPDITIVGMPSADERASAPAQHRSTPTKSGPLPAHAELVQFRNVASVSRMQPGFSPLHTPRGSVLASHTGAGAGTAKRRLQQAALDMMTSSSTQHMVPIAIGDLPFTARHSGPGVTSEACTPTGALSPPAMSASTSVLLAAVGGGRVSTNGGGIITLPYEANSLADMTLPSTGMVSSQTAEELGSLARPLDLFAAGAQVSSLAKLAQGAHGIVYKGLWHGCPAAIKFMLASGTDNLSTQLTEVLVHRALSHPSIVQTYGCNVWQVTVETVATARMLTATSCSALSTTLNDRLFNSTMNERTLTSAMLNDALGSTASLGHGGVVALAQACSLIKGAGPAVGQVPLPPMAGAQTVEYGVAPAMESPVRALPPRGGMYATPPSPMYLPGSPGGPGTQSSGNPGRHSHPHELRGAARGAAAMGSPGEGMLSARSGRTAHPYGDALYGHSAAAALSQPTESVSVINVFGEASVHAAGAESHRLPTPGQYPQAFSSGVVAATDAVGAGKLLLPAHPPSTRSASAGGNPGFSSTVYGSAGAHPYLEQPGSGALPFVLEPASTTSAPGFQDMAGQHGASKRAPLSGSGRRMLRSRGSFEQLHQVGASAQFLGVVAEDGSLGSAWAQEPLGAAAGGPAPPSSSYAPLMMMIGESPRRSQSLFGGAPRPSGGRMQGGYPAPPVVRALSRSSMGVHSNSNLAPPHHQHQQRYMSASAASGPSFSPFSSWQAMHASLQHPQMVPAVANFRRGSVPNAVGSSTADAAVSACLPHATSCMSPIMAGPAAAPGGGVRSLRKAFSNCGNPESLARLASHGMGGGGVWCSPPGMRSMSGASNAMLQSRRSALTTGEVDDHAAEEAGARSLAQVLGMLGARDGQMLVQIVMEEMDRGTLHNLLTKAMRDAPAAANFGSPRSASATPTAVSSTTVGASTSGAAGGGGSASGAGHAGRVGSTSLEPPCYAPFLSGGRWTQQQALRAVLLTAKEIALGMAFLHVNNILHGDLKPANVLLRSSRTDLRGFVAKISDFGLSRVLHSREAAGGVGPGGGRGRVATDIDHLHETQGDLEEEQGEQQGRGLVRGAHPDANSGAPSTGFGGAVQGTVAYLAPETLDGHVTKAADVYSYGVVLWQLVTGRRPYDGLMPEQILAAVSTMGMPGTEDEDDDEDGLLAWPAACHPALAALGRACLAPDPKARPTFALVVRRLLALESDMRAAQEAAAAAASVQYQPQPQPQP